MHLNILHSIILFLALATSAVAEAQIYSRTTASGTATDSTLQVSLLTAAPGEEVYQLEGHSALRFRSATADVVANWGIFDFDTPNFVYRFVKGETDYCVALIPFSYFIIEYSREHRRVTEQILNLSPQQASKLAALVIEAVQPEKRTYRYNYVLDNCATRPIEYIERAVGDSIHFHAPSTGISSSVTFRSEMRRFHRNYPWYQFGIDLALGPGIDYPITLRQSTFAPVTLEKLAATATIGDSIPLVRSTDILVQGDPDGAIKEPTPWYLTPMSVCWAVAIIIAITVWRASKKHSMLRGITAIWFTIVGLAGCVVAFLVFISSHEASSPNWIILWVNPICFIVPLTIYIRKAAGLLRYYMIANIATIGAYLLAVIFGVQSPNAAFIPLLIADLLLSLSYVRQSHNA